MNVQKVNKIIELYWKIASEINPEVFIESHDVTPEERNAFIDCIMGNDEEDGW